MQARVIVDDLLCSLDTKPTARGVVVRQQVVNGRMKDVLYWERGHVHDLPDAFRLVQMGACEPADEECRLAVGLSPAQIAEAIRVRPSVEAGIHPDDREKFFAGQIAGYNPDGSYKPGPNFAELADDDEEDEDDGE